MAVNAWYTEVFIINERAGRIAQWYGSEVVGWVGWVLAP